jgi:uncharacterized protein (TIGR02118 family)
MIKFTILLRRRPEMSHDDFVAYHRRQHAPLFMSMPVVQQHVRRYVQQHTLEVTMPGLPPTSVDGVTELWFDDVESIATVFTAESYLEVVRPDEAKFLDLEHCEFLISEEHPVFPQ